MNAFAHFPSRLHWTAQQLADAVPLRLHEMFVFDAAHGGGEPAANNSARGPRDAAQAHAYAARSPLPARFGVR